MKIIQYINQFFAGLGGEEAADTEPRLIPGAVGPSQALQSMLSGEQVTFTVVCGDNFMGSHTQEAVDRILKLLEDRDFDLLVAGPAFQAGRYGFACGTICKAVHARFSVPVLTSMHEENPGVNMFKKDVIIFRGGKSAVKMRADTAVMASYISKMAAGETLPGAAEAGYYPRGIRHQAWRTDEKSAAARGVDMLIKKLHGESFETELPVPPKDLVSVAPPITDMAHARLALVTSGGIVPADNPDRIQSASATRWGRYNISKLDRLESGVYKTIHAGFDPAAANADPNVILPLDAMRILLKKGRYGSLHDYFYSTVGTGTTEAEARRMAREIIPYLKQDKVDAIILGST